jgi:hypothetical protein
MFFNHRKRMFPVSEADIQAVRKQYLDKIETSTENTKQLNRLLRESDGGFTGMIWAASGGDRRIKK